MITSFMTFVPIALLAVWIFFRTSPKAYDVKPVRLFNRGVLIAGLVLCGITALTVYGLLAGEPDEPWWPVLASLGALIVLPVSLLVGGFVRNVVVFRKPKSEA